VRTLGAENFQLSSRLTYCLQQRGLLFTVPRKRHKYQENAKRLIAGTTPRDMADFVLFIVSLMICETRIGTSPLWQRHRQRNL
jgi:hypothetical protein